MTSRPGYGLHARSSWFRHQDDPLWLDTSRSKLFQKHRSIQPLSSHSTSHTKHCGWRQGFGLYQARDVHGELACAIPEDLEREGIWFWEDRGGQHDPSS
jgi:hypothetical protein